MATLDPGKLTSVDAQGARINIIPAEVRGFFRRHRDWTQIVLLIVFLALPWTTVNGHQTIFINLPNREFALFGLIFRSHDAPLLFFIVAAFLMLLALVTAIWGRVWCGWACPQTVFIDAVYRRIETWVEGNYIERRKMRDQPLTKKGFLKKSTKWFLFFVVSSLISHSFIAYFVGAKNLIEMMTHKPSENLTYFFLVMSFTAVTLFNFGWFREQFCVIMCPYGRLQGLFLEHNSLAVVYDVARGEPRKSTVPPGKPFGDCVSCNRCVQVCPTGIDIRNGLQMECITCTACIDACDEIMEKVKKPKGLIRYETLDGKPLKIFTPRSMIYAGAVLLLVGLFSYSLWTRSPVDFTVLRGLGLPYTQIAPDRLMNHFKIQIHNQGELPANYRLSTLDDVQLTVAENPLRLMPGQHREWHFFVQFHPKLLNQKGQFKIPVRVKDEFSKTPAVFEKEMTLLGPAQ